MKHVILFADNERGIRQYIKQELEAEGYDVVLTEDGTDALDLMRQFVVDVVILDEHMPRCSGRDAARSIKQHHPDLPVILFTADTDYERFKSRSIDMAIIKSADLGQLKAAIAKLLKTGNDSALLSPTTITPALIGAEVERSELCRGAGLQVPHSQ
jgi:DNA-binding response OmpR family regulator